MRGPSVVAALVLAPWLVWTVVRTFGLEHGYPMVAAMAFTPYVALTAWLPVGVALLTRSWRVAATAVICAAVLAASVLPRAFAGPRPDVAHGRPLVVMSSNLLGGRGDAATVVSLVRRYHVDVLSLQELTPEAVARLDAAGLQDELPYRAFDAAPRAQGTGLAARRPLRRTSSPLDGPMAQPAVRLSSGVAVQAVHPPPPLRGDVGTWEDILRSMPAPRKDGPLRLLVGDFNATLDHDELRDLLDRGYLDAGDATGQGLAMTFPAGRKRGFGIAIDHVLVDDRIRPEWLKVHVLPGSDHRAIVARLTIPTDRAGAPPRVRGSAL